MVAGCLDAVYYAATPFCHRGLNIFRFFARQSPLSVLNNSRVLVQALFEGFACTNICCQLVLIDEKWVWLKFLWTVSYDKALNNSAPKLGTHIEKIAAQTLDFPIL